MDRCISISGTLAEQLEQPMLKWAHTLYLALRALVAGDLDRVEGLTREALELGTAGGQADATLYFGIQLTSLSIQRGTMGELVPLIEQVMAEAPYLTGAATAVLAFSHVEGGAPRGRGHPLGRVRTRRLRSPPQFVMAYRHGRLRRSGHRHPVPRACRGTVRPVGPLGRSVVKRRRVG